MPSGAINIGEAAHIYGANPGSARYDPGMESVDRGAITNAIWLCGNCHKMIDDDPDKYPAGLLFEWHREHEKEIAERVGKTAADVRRRYEKRHLEGLGRLSYLAERLVLEKGDYWEYLLTAEVLRSEVAPIVRRWDALKRGLYVGKFVRISKEDSFSWVSDRAYEMGQIVNAFSGLTNYEFSRSWGAAGVPGNDVEIVGVCRLFGEVCRSTLEWEESVRFARVDSCFEEVRGLFVGVAGTLIENAVRIPDFLLEVISKKPDSGHYELVLNVKLPDGWATKSERL